MHASVLPSTVPQKTPPETRAFLPSVIAFAAAAPVTFVPAPTASVVDRHPTSPCTRPFAPMLTRSVPSTAYAIASVGGAASALRPLTATANPSHTTSCRIGEDLPRVAASGDRRQSRKIPGKGHAPAIGPGARSCLRSRSA
jgi:hypothetical protein